MKYESVRLTVDSTIYGEAIIHKILYWKSKDYVATIKSAQNLFEIDVIKKNNSPFTQEEKDEFCIEFNQLLIDFKTRAIILAETKNIRDLIIMKAFFHFSNEPVDFENILKS